MAAFEAVVLAGSAGVTVVAVATILVIVGARQQERRNTLTRRHPPTISAWLARRVLGTYVRMPPEQHDELGDPRNTSRQHECPPGHNSRS